MSDRAALLVAFGTFGLTAVIGAVFCFIAVRRFEKAYSDAE